MSLARATVLKKQHLRLLKFGDCGHARDLARLEPHDRLFDHSRSGCNIGRLGHARIGGGGVLCRVSGELHHEIEVDRLRLGGHRVFVGQGARGDAVPAKRVIRELQVEHLLDGRAALDIGQRQREFSLAGRDRVARCGSQIDPAGEFHPKLKVAGDDCHQLLKFGAEDFRDQLGAGDIVVVSARFLGHTRDQLFIVIRSETEEGAGDAALLDFVRVLDEGSEVLDSSGRISVR